MTYARFLSRKNEIKKPLKKTKNFSGFTLKLEVGD